MDLTPHRPMRGHPALRITPLDVAGPYGAGLMWEATGHYRSAFVTFGCFGILAFGVNLYTIKFAAEQLAVAAAVAAEGKQDRQGGTAVGEEASQATSI